MLSKLKEKLIKSIRSRKLNVFGLFFLLALLFWSLTKLSKEYTETIPFEIVYKNVPEDHHVAIDSTDFVNVTLNSYGFNLFPYYFYKPKLNIDFESDVYIKNKSYIWNATENRTKLSAQFKSAVRIVSIKPDTLRFPFQALATKKVPVKSKIALQFAPGYDISSPPQITPDSVKIIGSKKILDKIKSVYTQDFEIKNINSDINVVVALDLSDSFDQLKISAKTIKLSADVQKFTEGTFEVPITIVNLPPDKKINYFPKTIPIAYTVSLDKYKNVKASDFKLECDYNNIKKTDKTFLIPKLVKSPEIVKSVRLKQKKVEFIIIK